MPPTIDLGRSIWTLFIVFTPILQLEKIETDSNIWSLYLSLSNYQRQIIGSARITWYVYSMLRSNEGLGFYTNLVASVFAVTRLVASEATTGLLRKTDIGRFNTSFKMKPFNLRALAVTIMVGTIPEPVCLCADLAFFLISDSTRLPIGLQVALGVLIAFFLTAIFMLKLYLRRPPS